MSRGDIRIVVFYISSVFNAEVVGFQALNITRQLPSMAFHLQQPSEKRNSQFTLENISDTGS